MIEECRIYWDRLPKYKRIKYFTELKCESIPLSFDTLPDDEREKVIKHISRIINDCKYAKSSKI